MGIQDGLIPTLLMAGMLISCTKTAHFDNPTNSDKSPSIIGGEIVGSDDTSIQGTLKMKTKGCSSVQVNSSLVLTAAHCTRYEGKRAESVAFSGGYDQHQSIVTGELWAHPHYENLITGYDLAVAVLNGPTRLDTKNNFALPQNDQLPDELFIAGYGATNFNPSGSKEDQLKKLKIDSSKQRLFEISKKTLDPEIDWENIDKFQEVDKRIKGGDLYCFKPLAPDTGMPFSGDSGGPLYSIDQNGVKTVHGIYSIHIYTELYQQYYFFCYESIYPKLKWIQQSISKSSSGLSHGLTVKLSDKSIQLKNKVTSGVDTSNARQTKGEILDAGIGSPQDLLGKELGGRILLMKRGEIRFSEKIRTALLASSEIAGILLYDNVDEELFTPATDSDIELPPKIDIRFISKKDGEFILNELNNGNKVEALLTIPNSEP
jgi:hypothetical protein